MSFVSVLIALLLEQARPLARSNPVHVSLRAWVHWCSRSLDAGQPVHAWLAWSLALGLPTLAVLLVHLALMVWAGWPLAVLWSVAVLYVSLGFRQFSFHFTEIRDALSQGDEVLARSLLAHWRQTELKEVQGSRLLDEVIQTSVLEAHRHVFGVLAWFSILAALGLGPTGAVMYRLGEFVARSWRSRNPSRHSPVSPALRHHAQSVWLAMDWLPARLTATGFAVVGNFEEAIDGWRSYTRHSPFCNQGVLLAATAGAVNIDLNLPPCEEPAGHPGAVPADAGAWGGGDRPAPELHHLAVVVGLVWRTVVMWVLLLALLTLANLLG